MHGIKNCKVHKTDSWLFEKVNKMNKPPFHKTERDKGEDTPYQTQGMKKGVSLLTTETQKGQRGILRTRLRQMLSEMNQFLKKHKLP